MFTDEHFTTEYSKELVKEFGTIEKAAQSLAPKCTSRRYPGQAVSWRTVERWISNALSGRSQETPNLRVLSGGRATRETVGSYQTVAKGKDGEPQVLTLERHSVQYQPDVPKFPVIQAATPTTIVYNAAPYISRPITYGVVVSDVQYGFLRNQANKELVPIHDPRALGIAKQIISDVRPNQLYFIGDFVDWSSFSRWQKYPEYYGTMQETVDGAYGELGEIIATAGHQCTKRVMVGSNHQQRPEKFVLENNMDALNIRRANTPPSGWPVFSEQYLLRYDDLGLEFSGAYPGGFYWVLPDLGLNHAPTRKLEFAASVIHGHTHHRSITTWSQHTSAGRKNYYLYDCGCLCQLDSYQTVDKHSLVPLRVPSDQPRSDWGQGFAVISILDGKIPKHEVELIKIDNGSAIYRGQYYEAP